MNLFIKEYTDCLKQAFASFSPEEVSKEFETALINLQKKTSFPGYRQGKVPFDIIEKNNYDELMRALVNSMVMKTVEKMHTDGVVLYSEPNFKPLSNIERGKPFSFSMTFDSSPKVLENIDIEKSSVEFDEYFYDDKMLEYSIKKDFKNLEEVTGKVEEGDTVTITVTNSDYSGEDKEKSLDSAVLKALIGKKKGDKMKLSFGELDSYVVEFLGKTASSEAEFSIAKIERAVEQDVTDEMVQQISVFKNIADYRKAIQNRLDNMLKDFNNLSKKTALVSYIAKNAKVEFPKTEYLRDSGRETSQFIDSNFHVSEIALKDILADQKIRTDFSALPDKIYENIVFYLAVRDLADKNGLQPDKATIDRVAYSRAREHDLSMEDFKQKSSRDEWNSVLEMAKFETALNFLIEKIKFKSKNKLPLVKMK